MASKKRPPARRLKPRNPIARQLRDPLFRARRERSRRKYARRPKHPKPPEEETQ